MIRNILTLLSGNAAAQLINVATIIWVVSKYISPEVFGLYAVLMSYVGILSSVTCLRFELGIVSERSERAANNLVGLSLLVAFGFAVLTGLLSTVSLWLWGDAFLFGVPLLVTIAVLFTKALDQIGASILYRNEAYKRYSTIKFIQSLVLLVGFFWSAKARAGTTGLMLATLAAYSVFAILAFLDIRQYRVSRGVTPKRVAAVARRHRDLVKFNTPQAFIDNLLANGVNFVLIAFAGPTVVGYYNFMQRIIRAPLGLVFGAVSQVVFRFAAKHVDQPSRLRTELGRLALISLALLVSVAFVISVFYANLEGLSFLSQWSGMRSYVPAFAVWMLAPFLFSPFATLPVVYGRQRQFLILASSYNLVSLGALTLLLRIGILQPAFMAIGLGSVLYFLALCAWVFRMPRYDTRI